MRSKSRSNDKRKRGSISRRSKSSKRKQKSNESNSQRVDKKRLKIIEAINLSESVEGLQKGSRRKRGKRNRSRSSGSRSSNTSSGRTVVVPEWWNVGKSRRGEGRSRSKGKNRRGRRKRAVPHFEESWSQIGRRLSKRVHPLPKNNLKGFGREVDHSTKRSKRGRGRSRGKGRGRKGRSRGRGRGRMNSNKSKDSGIDSDRSQKLRRHQVNARESSSSIASGRSRLTGTSGASGRGKAIVSDRAHLISKRSGRGKARSRPPGGNSSNQRQH